MFLACTLLQKQWLCRKDTIINKNTIVLVCPLPSTKVIGKTKRVNGKKMSSNCRIPGHFEAILSPITVATRLCGYVAIQLTLTLAMTL